MSEVSSMKEHIDVLYVVIGVLWALLLGVLLYVNNQKDKKHEDLKKDLDEHKKAIEDQKKQTESEMTALEKSQTESLRIAMQHLHDDSRDLRDDIKSAISAFTLQMNKVENALEKFSDELFDRVRKNELSLNSLWEQHRMRMKEPCINCGAHRHERIGDVHNYTEGGGD